MGYEIVKDLKNGAKNEKLVVYFLNKHVYKNDNFKFYRNNKKQVDFRNTETELNIKKDVYQIYDNSTKIYSTQTTIGKTLIKYETYAIGNVLTIVFNNKHYSIGSLDGSSDNPIFGLSYKYTNKKNTEHLTLIATDDLELTTASQLMHRKKNGYQQAKLNAQSITILKGSKLTLTIKQ